MVIDESTLFPRLFGSKNIIPLLLGDASLVRIRLRTIYCANGVEAN